MKEQLLSVGIDIGTSGPQEGLAPLGTPVIIKILGGSEFRLRKISARRRFNGLTPAPPRGAPVVEVPK